MNRHIITFLFLSLQSASVYSQVFDVHENLLQINFDSTFQDISTFNNAVLGNNIEYTADRFGNPNSALKLRGWCNGNPTYLRIPDSDNLEFDNNGFSISFWLKADLSSGMDPSNGACSPNGHHILFAKGGDGYGTSPNGFYSKLNPIAAGNSEHLFGSSAGSGNLNHLDTLSDVSSWHFYTYIVGQTTFDFYMDGLLIQSRSHSIDFTEANNEDLYIGILGPKSTPALGITNWFPLKGFLDEFNVFRGQLSLYEIKYLYYKDRTSQKLPPAISRLEFLERDKRLSGGRHYYWKSQLFEFEEDEKILLMSENGRSGYCSTSISKFNKDSLTATKSSFIRGYWDISNDFLFFENNQFIHIRDWVNEPDEISFYNSSLHSLGTISIGDFIIDEGFIRNDSLILIGKNNLNPTQTFVKILNLSGNLINEFSLNSEIRQVHYNQNELVLVSDSIFFRFNGTLTNFSSVSIPSVSSVLTKNTLILRQSTDVILYNLMTSSPSLLNQSVAQIFLAKDSADYFFVSGNIVERYDSLNVLQYSFEAPIDLSQNYCFAHFENNYFVFRRSNPFHEIFLVNHLGEILHTKIAYGPAAYAPFFDFAFFDNGAFIYSTDRLISKFSSNGELIWEKALNNTGPRTNKVSANSDNSFWAISSVNDHILVKINNNLNRCDYNVINPFEDVYCPSINENLHQIEPLIQGSLASWYQKYYINRYYIIRPYEYFNFDFVWKKDGVTLSEDYFGKFSGDGEYEFSIKQEECEVSSPSKNVVYSVNANPNNVDLSIDNSMICNGQSATITAICNSSNLKWLDGFEGSYPNPEDRLANPTNTTSYFAFCEEKFYDREVVPSGTSLVLGAVCQSPISSISINVIQPTDILELNGISQDNQNYFTGRLFSSQIIPSSLNHSSYEAIRSIDLKPGFQVEKGTSFIAQIEKNCIN